MGDLNCNLLSKVASNNSSYVLNIIDIYDLTQLILEISRVTQDSSTLINLCLTIPQIRSISKSGVINIGISDHSASIDLSTYVDMYDLYHSVIPTVAQISEKMNYDQTYHYLNENGLLNSGQHWRETIAGVSILIEVFLMV